MPLRRTTPSGRRCFHSGRRSPATRSSETDALAEPLEEEPEEALAAGDDQGLSGHSELDLAAPGTPAELSAMEADPDGVLGPARLGSEGRIGGEEADRAVEGAV